MHKRLLRRLQLQLELELAVATLHVEEFEARAPAREDLQKLELHQRIIDVNAEAEW
jgi:hypothetical protein